MRNTAALLTKNAPEELDGSDLEEFLDPDANQNEDEEVGDRQTMELDGENSANDEDAKSLSSPRLLVMDGEDNMQSEKGEDEEEDIGGDGDEDSETEPAAGKTSGKTRGVSNTYPLPYCLFTLNHTLLETNEGPWGA